MEYIKDQIRRLINWANSGEAMLEKNYYGNAINSKSSSSFALSGGISGHNGGLNFTVHSATGGKVIQVQSYNIHTDQSRSTLYVITDKEDLGHELGQIITVESLSR
jgi:hypothetical protein